METVDKRRLALRRSWSHAKAGAELHMTHCERSVRHVEVKHTIGWASRLMPQPCLDHLRKANTVRDLCRHRRRWLDFFSVQSHCGNEGRGDENGGIRLFLLLLIIRLLGLPPLLTASVLRRSKQRLLGAGWPLNISLGPYRKAVQQQEQLTITGCCGAGSALSRSACSVCGSMARQVTVHLHFLHFTTQASGNSENISFTTKHYRRIKGEAFPFLGIPRVNPSWVSSLLSASNLARPASQ
jgi:hypothetical protein